MANGESRLASEAARLLAGRRRIIEGACEVCSQQFMGTSKRKFCSHVCAQRSYWQNKQASMAEQNKQNSREGVNDGR